MRARIFGFTLLATSLILPGVTHGEEFLAFEGGPAPDHLIPFKSIFWDDYEKLLVDRLFAQPHGAPAQCIVCPSFSGEYCLTIAEIAPEDWQTKYGAYVSIPDEQKKFFMKLARAKSSLFASMPSPPNNHQDTTKQVEVEHTELQIDKSLAVAIQRAFATATLRTRYHDHAATGRDGTTYFFSAFVRGLGDTQGKCWSPSGGMPAELVKLTEQLVQLAQAKSISAEERQKIVAGLRRFCAKYHKN